MEYNNGYHPGRGARQPTLKLQDRLFLGRVRCLLEADIEGFFEHIDHGWLIRMIELRVLEENGSFLHPVHGLRREE